MPHAHDHLDDNRLLDAADASLRAAALRIAQVGVRAIEHPADLIGTPLQPECLAPFTKHEIEEACGFLVRLGLFEHPEDDRAPR